MKQKLNIFLGLGLVIQLSSYFLPFLEKETGYLFFFSGLETFWDKGILWSNWFLFVSFFFPILFLPLLFFAYKRRGIFKNKNLDYGLFFLLILAPVGSTIWLVVERNSFELGDLWGFFTWVGSFLMLYIFYILRLKEPIEEEEDMTKHLIDNEE